MCRYSHRVSLEAHSGLVGVELIYGHGSAMVSCSRLGKRGCRVCLSWPGFLWSSPLPVPCLAHGLWCQDCTLANSSHCAPKQCQPTDTVCASVRITDPSSSKSGPGKGTHYSTER